MKLNDFFENIFLINLERRIDRLIGFNNKAKEIGFEFEIFKAIDGRGITEDTVYNGNKISISRNKYYVDGFSNYSKSQIGCLISHLEVLKLAKQRGYNNFLVLEDDCEFKTDFNQEFDKFIQEFDKEWDMLYFSGSMIEYSDKFLTYRRLTSCHTTHSYAVNSRCLDYLIDHIESNINNMPIDSSYVEIQNELKCYITFPFLTFQEEGFSDIQNRVVDYDSIKKYL